MHKFCLTKQNILSKSEITKAFNNVETKIYSEHFTYLISDRETDNPGICVILAKKNIKKATQRNQCRRVIKEYFRLNKELLSHKCLVVLGKKPASVASKEQLWQSVKNLQNALER